MNHKSNNASIDWQELDRLVDGRLTDDGYRELLCQIDADPNGWKQCALAFLEHQALEKELGAFAQDPSCQMLPCMGAIVAENKSGGPESELAPKSITIPNSGSIMGWLSMAACIVCGLALGFTINSNFQDSTAPTVPTGSIVADMERNLFLQDTELTEPSTSVVGKVAGQSSCATNKCDDRHPCERRYHLENRKQGIKHHDPTLTNSCPVIKSIQNAEKSPCRQQQ